MRTAHRFLWVTIAFAVASCGGGYGGGGNGMRAASVTLTVDPTEITVGQSATLTWGTNGANCTASGDWSGAQDASGSLTVTPSSPGTHDYSLVCTGGSYGQSNKVTATLTVDAATATSFSMSALVSDGSVSAATTDAKLVNPWGIVFAPGAPVWVADNGSQSATVYDGTGTPAPVVVSLPAGLNGDADGTGIVANATTTDFVITKAATSAGARFLFSGENGTIMGWSPSVDGTHAVIGYDDGAGGASYTGLAIANDGTAQHLYAADFANGKVDVFDATFTKVTVAGGFTDGTLPDGYAPFGIQAVTLGSDTRIVVAYAKRDAGGDETVGAGLGVVNVFDTAGTLVTHLVPQGAALDAPWGIALAPADFGALGNKLLIGNFGDGVINAYDPADGTFAGCVKDSAGNVIANPGLWGIAFGNGAHNQPANTLYFAAGIAGETAGLYGRIDQGDTPPDTVAPTVTLTTPTAGEELSSTVPVTANAADNVGVAQVEFFAGTTSIGVDTTAPYSVNWNTTTVANGDTSLTAVAKDAFGNATTSAAVAVTVNNAAGPPTVTLAQIQSDIFTPHCASCHTGTGGSLPGSMNLTSATASRTALVNVTSVDEPTFKRVLPGNPDDSYIIHKLEGTQVVGSRMPLGGPFLDQAQIDEVRSWIQAGANP